MSRRARRSSSSSRFTSCQFAERLEQAGIDILLRVLLAHIAQEILGERQ
jgi:hypothetical protein